jgi:hypothetical protein
MVAVVKPAHLCNRDPSRQEGDDKQGCADVLAPEGERKSTNHDRSGVGKNEETTAQGIAPKPFAKNEQNSAQDSRRLACCGFSRPNSLDLAL